MSIERDLLSRCAVTLKARDICPLLLTEISELLRDGDLLYTSPPRREPLSDEEIGAHTPFYYYDTEQKAFTHGVRLAEQQHGIGVDDE